LLIAAAPDQEPIVGVLVAGLVLGVAVVPASSFYRSGDADAKRRIRFCYPKKDETLLEAGRRLAALAER
jgi:aspartate/methionine/tyrosine aminotransferase